MEKINIDFSKIDNASKAMIANSLKASLIMNRFIDIANEAMRELNKMKRPKTLNYSRYKSIIENR